MFRSHTWLAATILTLASVPLQAAVEFYVDPDWAGTASGNASAPWVKLDGPAWSTINAELDNGPVTVYFSARQALADSNQTTVDRLNIRRTSTSQHRLVLDGMSRYNANDASPDWRSYSGRSRYEIRSTRPLTTDNSNGGRRYRFTVRGFRTLSEGGQSVFINDSEDAIVEHCEVSHALGATGGPGLHLGAANGFSRNIVFRKNVVHDTYGEGVYISGASHNSPPETTAAHTDILVEDNIIYDIATRGGQSDGIDVKDNDYGVVIRGNTVYRTGPGTGRDGIVAMSASLIEGNYIYGYGRSGIVLSVYWNARPGVRANAVVKDNIIRRIGGEPSYSGYSGIAVTGSNDGDQWTDVVLRNNTVYDLRSAPETTKTATSISVARQATGAVVRNNIVVTFATWGLDISGAGDKQISNNLVYNAAGGNIVRIDSQKLDQQTFPQYEPSSVSQSPMFQTNPPNLPADFCLSPQSPAISRAAVFSQNDHDFFSKLRGPTDWDMGACEFLGEAASSPPGAPANLRVRNN